MTASGLLPTAEVLLANSLVQEALQSAWIASQSADAVNRHEEGGWVYWNPLTSELAVRRAPAGARAQILLVSPPMVPGFLIVATFHTHPNPASEGWETRPSSRDEQVADWLGVPSLIRAEDGDHWTGPACRRGGIAGPPGFPAQTRLPAGSPEDMMN